MAGSSTLARGAATIRRLNSHGLRTRRSPVAPTRIALGEPSPYLASLIEEAVPGAQLIDADDDGPKARPVDLRIVPVSTPEQAQHIAHRRGRESVIAVVDAERASEFEDILGPHGVISRPFLRAEVDRALRRTLRVPYAVQRARAFRAAGLRAVARPARVLGVALSALLEATTTPGAFDGPFLAIALAYAVARGWMRLEGRTGAAVDIAVAALVLAPTGGIASNFAPFAIILVMTAGLELGVVAGTLSGLGVALVAPLGTILSGDSVRVQGLDITIWLALFVLGGLASSYADLSRRAHPSSLHEVNSVLASLYRMARAMPGGLQVSTIASSVMAEVRESLDATAGLFLVKDLNAFIVAESFGVHGPEIAARISAAEMDALLRSGPVAVPEPTARVPLGDTLEGARCAIYAPIRRRGELLGVIVAGCPDEERHDDVLSGLRALSEEAAVAVENATLFARVRELSVDEERRRLARDLHDGVAQALAHVRLELDLLRRIDVTPEGLGTELGRLTRVVARAEADTRSAIRGLHASVASDGLVRAVRSYLRDMAGLGGPELILEATTVVRAHPEAEAEMFRIVQEAVSNAIRHSHARTIRVELTGDENHIAVVVDDDGIGIAASSVREGVGLRAMRERAAQLGAGLSVRRSPQGGTRVELIVPVKTGSRPGTPRARRARGEAGGSGCNAS